MQLDSSAPVAPTDEPDPAAGLGGNPAGDIEA
jgi:hypothetical protein